MLNKTTNEKMIYATSFFFFFHNERFLTEAVLQGNSFTVATELAELELAEILMMIFPGLKKAQEISGKLRFVPLT